MEMGSSGKVETIKPEGEIYTCPVCGYTDGFHVSFRVDGTTGRADVYLICPNCHSRFRPGWQINLSDT